MLRTHATFYADRLTVVVNGQKSHRSTPPPGSGTRLHSGFKPKQRTAIVRAAEHLAKAGPCDFVTLTFPYMGTGCAYAPVMAVYTEPAGKSEVTLTDENGTRAMPLNKPAQRVFYCAEAVNNVVSDADARKYLRSFLRSLKVDTYLWVAEVQPRRLAARAERAVHFHLMVPSLTGAIQERRAKIAEQWRRTLGVPVAVVDVQECYATPGAYLAKYIAKGDFFGKLHPHLWIQGNGYGMSQDVTAALAPLGEVVADGSAREYFGELLEQAVNEAKPEGVKWIQGRHYTTCEYGENPGKLHQIFWGFLNFAVDSGIKVSNVG